MSWGFFTDIEVIPQRGPFTMDLYRVLLGSPYADPPLQQVGKCSGRSWKVSFGNDWHFFRLASMWAKPHFRRYSWILEMPKSFAANSYEEVYKAG